ncbi:NDR1/HIN1-like protein 13 [Andrographis paniculata]|uniref:NDR1/HIN1-like protein 13 n=1 Tax=Andrographis paniculata TaxID=175694 RepID=UPI0021E9AC67|nr:NDR1/HIN1-like protein 13 [Andrographis paniculata]
MADPRIHPADTSDLPTQESSSIGKSPKDFQQPLKAPDLPPSKPVPPPATYVVQLPREQILRYPPPENARKYQALTRGKRQSCCRRCCCCVLCLLLLLVISAAVSAGVLYLVFRFKSPKYAVTSLAFKSMNLTSAAPLSPEIDVTVRAENPNGKVGIYYLKGSSVNVFYDGVRLGDGVLPVFFQPRKNVTVLQTALKGSDVVLGGNIRTALRNAQNRGRVPLVVRTKAPVKIKVGAVKTWEITVKVKCDVVMDGLTERAKILSHDCDFTVRFW